LFDLLPTTTHGELERIRRKSFAESFKGRDGDAVQIVRFLVSGSRPELPDSKDFDWNSLRGIFTYFDDELATYQRRYDYEAIGRGEWVEFIHDIRPWIALLGDLIGYTSHVIDRAAGGGVASGIGKQHV